MTEEVPQFPTPIRHEVQQTPPSPQKRTWLRWVPGAIIALLLSLTLIGGALAFYFPWPASIGPAQPIAFSHRVHVDTKQISCIFCHPGVAYSAQAQIPPVAKCMLCHQKIIPSHPEIIKVRQAYANDQPIAWVRVNDLPEFTYFSHERHVLQGFDCGQCHGNVAAMDRVAVVVEFKMGFCVQCHRDNNYSVDCLVCHR